jgi:hypothetical protein
MQFDMHEYSTRSSFNNDMYLPVPNTAALKKTLFYYGAKSWNSLPLSIEDRDSVIFCCFLSDLYSTDFILSKLDVANLIV